MMKQRDGGPQINTARPRWEDRSIVERLLLSLIDANPGRETELGGKSQIAARERRLRKAMSALFNVGMTAKGEQLQIDNRALWQMASEHHKDRVRQKTLNAAKPDEFGIQDTTGKKQSYRPRSERELAKEVANHFYGPFNEKVQADTQQRDGIAERLRKKWREQRELWLDSLLYSDNSGQLNDMRDLIDIWNVLRSAGIETVPNRADGNPITQDLAERMGIPGLFELVTKAPKCG
jgi:hypothetical protein